MTSVWKDRNTKRSVFYLVRGLRFKLSRTLTESQKAYDDNKVFNANLNEEGKKTKYV